MPIQILKEIGRIAEIRFKNYLIIRMHKATYLTMLRNAQHNI